jgi:hypothetical protein
MKVNGDRLILRRVNRGDIDVNLSSELIFRRSSVVIARSRRRISISFRNNIQCQIKKKRRTRRQRRSIRMECVCCCYYY